MNDSHRKDDDYKGDADFNVVADAVHDDGCHSDSGVARGGAVDSLMMMVMIMMSHTESIMLTIVVTTIR